MTGAPDPFAAVSAAVAAGGQPPAGGGDRAAKPKPPSGEWVAPVPDGAPDPRTSHNRHGKPSVSWAYRDGEGQLLHWVCRFDKADGAKEILPLTLWREGKNLEWRWKAAPVPRPLYGLDRLAANPAAPVLVVEGEKAADAGAALFPAFAVLSWSGGSKAVAKSDWAPLAGRRVVILPDADTPGREAAAVVAKLAGAAGADGVAVIALPSDLPQGWDCADAFPDGFALADLQSRLADALTGASAGVIDLPWGYQLNETGLWWHEPGKEDGAGRDVRLADGFEVLGEARDPDGGGWAVVIRFYDRDGRQKTETVKRAALASEAGAVRAALAGAGLFINPGRGKADRFAAFLAEVGHSRRLTLAERTGWIDASRFVMPSGVIGTIDAEPVLFDGMASALNYRQAGTLDGWQAGIAARAVGNSLLAFALSLGFVGPVMQWLGLEGGGFHFRGSSSTGKTSLAMAAGSIWGGGGALGFASSWRATGNALEGVAFGHSETLLILDELALVDPQEAGAAAYALATGQGKARARQDGALRRRSEWRVMLLSTGEIGLADHMRAAKRAERTMAGQELRLLDLSADMGAGMGAWQVLHGMDGPAVFSDAIKAATAKHYGHAGPAFVRGIVADRDRWRSEVQRQLAAFVARAKREGDSGQIHRAALRFGAVAAAGEVASALGVVPWPVGAAQAAALACFERWADGFGRKGVREERQVLEVVRNAIQQNLSRFSKVPAARLQGDDDEYEVAPAASNREGEARSLSTLGYLHEIDFQPCYLFHDAGFTEILKGFDLPAATEMLRQRGYLVVGKDGRSKRVQRIGGATQRFYTVRGSILEYDENEPVAGNAETVAAGVAGGADDTPSGWD